MATTATLPGNLGVHLFSARINILADTIKAMLTTATFAPVKDTLTWKSEVTNEITGTGYTAGGATLGSKTLTYDAATDTTIFDAADTSWTSANPGSLTGRQYVIYKDTGTPATSPVIAYGTESADQTATNGGAISIIFDGTGIVRLAT